MTSFNVAENPMFPTDEKDSQSLENCCEQTVTNAKIESQLDLVLDHADPVKNFAHAFYGRFKFILPATTVISFVFCGQIFIANIFLNQESHQNFIFGGLQTKNAFSQWYGLRSRENQGIQSFPFFLCRSTSSMAIDLLSKNSLS